MFDLGWTELLVIGIVALIVVGPKDLPVLFRNVGRWVGKARGMAREFSRAMNEAADEAGVNDIAKGLKTATNPVGTAMDSVKDATRDLASNFDPTKFDADDKSGGKPAVKPGSETAKLSAERAESAKKIQAATARAAADRKAKEAAEAQAKADAMQAALDTAPDQAPDQDPETKA